MLSEASWTTLHKDFTCAMLSQEYYDNIEEQFFLYSIAWSLLDNIAQGFYLCNLVRRVLRQQWTEFFPKIEGARREMHFYGIESSKYVMKDLTVKKKL